MAWNNIKVPTSGGEILKPESGKSYRVRIVGEPYVFQSEYEDKLSTRYAMTIWNQDEKAAQILLVPGGAFREILGYAQNEDDWGDPEAYDFVVKKTGSGLETRWTIQPSPKKTPLLDNEKEAVSAIDLAEVLAKLPSVTHAYKASEMGENPFPKSGKELFDEARAKRLSAHSDEPLPDYQEDDHSSL